MRHRIARRPRVVAWRSTYADRPCARSRAVCWSVATQSFGRGPGGWPRLEAKDELFQRKVASRYRSHLQDAMIETLRARAARRCATGHRTVSTRSLNRCRCIVMESAGGTLRSPITGHPPIERAVNIRGNSRRRCTEHTRVSPRVQARHIIVSKRRVRSRFRHREIECSPRSHRHGHVHGTRGTALLNRYGANPPGPSDIYASPSGSTRSGGNSPYVADHDDALASARLHRDGILERATIAPGPRHDHRPRARTAKPRRKRPPRHSPKHCGRLHTGHRKALT